ncbi:hypothetical protein PCC6311_0145 [Synechococcus elongatus PCC 6311]|uniref:Uncharacterized protein n=3 Tax=Synechococcus elongatus TaxID=32046 RepID=Q31RZ7_SYNE7|nr:conserved hypothetical protein [Synechococcus elongatus PCC 7942 = FACHB-805]AJD56775.1 hypothetical protein M744_02365 [Synechococcus elongatus UTEX 2973]MBD2588004.1 hypothetical protein [Synechococcus elongatus FACHB-242]MBD2689072.1 hypothetical protein [Synechococcus elongatus FACHB-1061]UOW69922.1 hypothetical protein PCC7943_0145 [Synechococcus elongatus PCC 7943]UOW72643.1 hypothetical protein PCC6311_0145 [Synechococcus elongatus PCC 6311]UOW75364.1 hypothetical protein PCC6301pg_
MLKPKTDTSSSALRNRQIQFLRVWRRRRQQPRIWLASLGLLWSLWDLRAEWLLMAEQFTWAALRYAMLYHLLTWLVLIVCLTSLLGILVDRCWPQRRDRRLQRQLDRILAVGARHPLWQRLHSLGSEGSSAS